MLGISIYLQDLDLDYLKEVMQQDVNVIFSSLHIGEENYDDLATKLQQILAITKDKNIKFIPDISSRTLKKLNIASIEELASFGIEAIRLDYGFDINEIANLSNRFHIVLNGSTIKETDLIALTNLKVDPNRIWICHNFYPREYTGISKEKLIETNKMIRKYGFRIQAFVVGDQLKRFPFYQGLPTLEKHRYLPPFVATVELLKDGQVDDVIIGDSQASLDTLKYISQYLKDQTIVIKATLLKEYHHLYHKKFTIRQDEASDALRLLGERGKEVAQGFIYPRLKGTITIDNLHYGRYSGEIQICKHELPPDYRINWIGQIDLNWLSLIQYINSEGYFVLID